MQTSLALTALLMGLVGGPHCVAMCGAACAGIGRAAAPHGARALGSFQLGRLLGYALMGALAAGSVQALAQMGAGATALRPLWTMFHLAASLLGLVLLWQARQPMWVEHWGQALWRKTRSLLFKAGSGAPLVLGVAWAFMPCGLLYSALLVASLTAQAWQGAWIMALFFLGTSVSLGVAPGLLLRLRGGGSGAWGIRGAGLALVLTSGWALWRGLTQPSGLFCL